MIRSFKKTAILIIVILAIFSLFSCGDDADKATFSLNDAIMQDGFLTISVSSDVETIELNDYIVTTENAKVTIYSDEEMENEVGTALSLETGENIFYVRVKEGTTKNNYKIKIVRKKTFTVSFDSNGGSACNAVSVDEGTVLTAPSTVRIGYEFAGWDYDFANPITSDLQIKASWTAKQFKITSNDLASPIDVTFNENYTIPAAPEKLGFTFVKWVTEDGSAFPSTGLWELTQDVAITAEYQKNVYKITYVFGASVTNVIKEYTVEDAVVHLAPAIIPEGLNFAGWYTDIKYENPANNIAVGTIGDVTLYAKWLADEEIEHTITIDAPGFDFDKQAIPVFYGSTYTLPQVTDRTGFTYVWKIDDREISASGAWDLKTDATVTLCWIAIKYNIEYNYDNKTTNTNTVFEFTIETETITLQAPTRPNGTFLGWYEDPEFDENTKVTEIPKGTYRNLVLYAKFEITYQTLTYDPAGGSVSKDSAKYEIGEEFTLLVPEYPGYEFVGWYKDINNESSKLASGTWSDATDITVIAKWKAIEYEIKITINETTTETIKYTINDEVRYTTTPKNEEFIFKGWLHEQTKKIFSYILVPKGTIGNHSFVAQWSGFVYSYDMDNKTATLIKYSKNKVDTKVVIPNTVNYQGVDYTVTAIGANVFKDMGPHLSSYTSSFFVEIPKTLKTIGASAFKNCTDVQIGVILDKGVDLATWADSLTIGSDNNHVLDVIKGRRPAIGWSVYA